MCGARRSLLALVTLVGWGKGIYRSGMATPIAQWRSMTGIRRTSSSDSVRVTNSGSGVDHVLMRHITWGGTWHFERDGNFVYSDFEVYDCAFHDVGFENGSLLPSGDTANNHFESGTPFGTNSSQGSSFWASSNYATTGNYSASSSGSWHQGASTTWTRPITYTTNPPDKGAWSNVTVDMGW